MKSNIYLAPLILLLATVSCQHKDLCYDHPHNRSLRVVFDWSKATEPTGQNMELFLFPSEGGRPLHYQFYDIHGGSVNVPSETYKAVCANLGTGANRFNDDSYDEFTVTTRADIKSEDSVLEPDILYSDHSIIEIGDRTEQSLIMFPSQKTPRYTVIVRDIRNLGGAKNCRASLSSLSCGYLAVHDLPSDASHVQNFDMARAGETTLEGGVTIFGHRHSACLDHTLTLHFVLLDGKEFTCTADVSERMLQLTQERRMSGEIIVDMDIDIPRPISNGSGFQPTVDGWEGEEIDISM